MMTIYEHHDSCFLLLFSQGFPPLFPLSLERDQYISPLITEYSLTPSGATFSSPEFDVN